MTGNAAHFSGKADVYAAARPSYAPAALDFLAGLLPSGAAVADVGAGTGKFSVLLAEKGFCVTAVEPNGDMLAKLREIPGIRAVQAAAEATALPDGSADAATCAQAFHWFEPAAFRAECERILRPGGRIFIVYNRPGAAFYEDSELNWHRRRDDHRAQTEQRMENVRNFLGPGMREERFPNPVAYDLPGWQAYMLSHSHSPREGDPDYSRFLGSCAAMFEKRSENGTLRLPLETIVYTA
ncbi:MAG: class I SAM-dependent methyltransferase [Oscillospiraceae bacterium]|jgi:SAM-dependent methyltransferase|nr:class I SAM-dependent methyltransferase [Oscillospiraceae bacterium]